MKCHTISSLHHNLSPTFALVWPRLPACRYRARLPSQPACRHRADDDTDRLTVGIGLHMQLTSGRCWPDVVTGRQSRKCPSNNYKLRLLMGLLIRLPWLDVAASTKASGRLLLIGLLACHPNTALS